MGVISSCPRRGRTDEEKCQIQQEQSQEITGFTRTTGGGGRHGPRTEKRRIEARWFAICERLLSFGHNEWLKTEWSRMGRELKELKRLFPHHPLRRRLQKQWSLLGFQIEPAEAPIEATIGDDRRGEGDNR